MKAMRMMVVAAVLAAACLAAGSAHAAVFFAGEFNEDGEFVPDKNVKGPCFGVKYCTVSTEIADGKAVTKIEEEITGLATKVVTTVCIMPLPEGVVQDGLSARLTQAEVAVTGDPPMKFLTADAAEEVYEAIAKATGSARLLSLGGRPALMFSGFPLGQKAQLTVEFRQPVKEKRGLFEYGCPMPETGLAIAPVARLSITATVRDKEPLRAIFSPTHQPEVKRNGLREASVRVTADNWSGGNLFRLFYVADDAPVGLRVLAHRVEGDDEGYFMLVGNPTGSDKEKVIEKDVLFVLDTSGSMRGEKMEQARSAIEYCLANLNDGDRFNIVTFGTEVKTFRGDLVGKTKANLRAASDFVDELIAVGRTNISGALAKGLAGALQKGRPRIMIFLTDGTPTAGELVPDRIVEKLPEQNKAGTRVFVMGVGHDVNAHLLDRIAELTDGGSEYVAPEEEIDTKVAALYNRLSNPVLTDVQVAFGDLMTNSVYPKKLPALFRGSRIMISGRYRDGGKHTVTISGTLAGEKKQYICTAEFPGKPSTTHEFVAPLWAARKIGYLLQEIRLHGEDKELIDEVVRLSTKFGIITEYTEFIATAKEPMSAPAAAKEAQERMKKARAEQSGQWAVRQAENDKDLQDRMNVGDGANVYRDRQGKLQRADNIRQVAGRTFYLRDGRWVDAEEAGDRKVRKVKAFSKEYFELVRKNDEFRRAQSVGKNVTVNVGSERIVVE